MEGTRCLSIGIVLGEEDVALGDHIYVVNSIGGIPFQHHGIDMGDGTVVHLAPQSGARIALRDTSDEFAVRRDSMEEFCRGASPERVEHIDALSPHEVVANAERRLGETGYDLLEGNCEHFATWCATGHSESHQIEMGQATVSAVASMATKAVWSVSNKVGSRLAVRGAMRVHPATLLADGVEMATLAVSCRQGLSAGRARRLARWSGTAAAAGIGGIVGGPAGAVLSVAAHSSSSALADRLCSRVRELVGSLS